MDNYIDSDYFYDKCIWMIAYCDNPMAEVSCLFNVMGLDTNRMYNVLTIFLTFNVYCLDKGARTKLSFLVKFLRNGSVNKEKFIAMENALSDNGLDCTSGFVLSQYEKRFGLNALTYLADEKNKNKCLNYLKIMIVNDFNVLFSHSNNCSDKEFNSEYIGKFLSDMYAYIGSVNLIAGENPNILNNKLFINRVKIVCNAYDLMREKRSDIFKKTYSKFKNSHIL